MKIVAFIALVMFSVGIFVCASALCNLGHSFVACTISFWNGLLTCAITAHIFVK